MKIDRAADSAGYQETETVDVTDKPIRLSPSTGCQSCDEVPASGRTHPKAADKMDTLLKAIADRARLAGFTEEDLAAELAAHKDERSA